MYSSRVGVQDQATKNWRETIGRFKARCCLLGNIMDPSESSFSSPTPRLSSFRYALSWAAKTGAQVWSADVMQAFLLAPPAEPIYASFPPGFEDPNGKVMYLLKNLYGSTTAPFMFNNYLSNSLIIQGFTPNEFDPRKKTRLHGEAHGGAERDYSTNGSAK